MKKNTLIISVLILIAVGGLGYSIYTRSFAPGKLDGFAQCIKDSGTIFYGAFWCPHCQNQKKLFGNSEKLLPYVECSTPNGQAQTQECIDKKITNYPTWVYPDGSTQTGEVSLEDLSAKTSCVLPN